MEGTHPPWPWLHPFLLPFEVPPWPLFFLTQVFPAFVVSYEQGSFLVSSDGDVNKFLSIRFQLSGFFLRECQCPPNVLALSVFIIFINLKGKLHESIKLSFWFVLYPVQIAPGTR